MAVSSCGNFESNVNATELVNDGYSTYQKFAQDAVFAQNEMLAALQEWSLALKPVETAITYDPNLLTASEFTEPQRIARADYPDLTPKMPALDYNPSDALATELSKASFPATAPTYEGQSVSDVTLALPGPEDIPEPITQEAPDDAPTLSNITVPAVPSVEDLNLPDVPVANTITIPTAQELLLPTWNTLVPDQDIPAPTGSFSWSEAGYSSGLLDELTAKVQEMLQGGNGLPDAIWNLIWERATRALAEQRDAALQEAMERWASRGFSAPGGALNAQIRRVEAQFQNLSAEQLRDSAIKHAEQEFQALQFAVSQGIALEGQLIGLYSQMAGRSLEAAKAVFDVANAIFSAKITKYNADVQAYVAQANVHKTLIDAELAKLEQFKLELEGQKLIGDINQQQVQLYVAQVEAAIKTLDVTKVAIEAVNAQIAADKNKVELFATRVSAYGETVKAKVAEYDLFEKRIKAELAKLDVPRVQTEIFAKRVDAYNGQVGAEAAKLKVEMDRNNWYLDKFKAYLAKWETEVKLEMSRLEGEVKVFEADIKRYSAESDNEKTKLGHQIEANKLAIEEAKNQTELELKDAEQTIQQAFRILVMQQDAIKTMLATQSQLAASAMSAVNLSATIQSSFGVSWQQSKSCSQTISG